MPSTASASSSPAGGGGSGGGVGNSQQQRRPSLWKRLGRRGSKTGGSSIASSSQDDVGGTRGGGGANSAEVPPLEADNGNARSLSVKRAQRQRRPRSQSRDSAGSLLGKLRTSFRRGIGKSANGSAAADAATASSERHLATPSNFSQQQSPAYSTDSYQTVEVRNRQMAMML